MKLKKVAAGCYELPDGRQVVRTEWDGPNGGRRYLWEVVTYEQIGGWTINGDAWPTYTLREMREQFSDQLT